MFFVVSGFPLTWEPHIPENATPVSGAYIASFLRGGESFKVVLLSGASHGSNSSIQKDRTNSGIPFTASGRQIAGIVNDLMRLPELEQIRKLKQDYLEVYYLEEEALIRAQVDSALEWHSGKDSISLLARMVKFGKWKNRYRTRMER